MSTRELPTIPARQPANGELPRNGTTGTVLAVEPNRPRRVPVGEVGGRKLDLLIRDFARFINSEVALLCQGVAEAGRLRSSPRGAWGQPTRSLRDHAKEGSSAARYPCRARPSNRSIPSSIRAWCPRPAHRCGTPVTMTTGAILNTL